MNMRPNPVTGFPGRSYRFFTEKVLYPFGFGLSYTTFEHRIEVGELPSLRLSRYLERTLRVEVFVTVKNVGEREGDESELLFAKSPLVGAGA